MKLLFRFLWLIAIVVPISSCEPENNGEFPLAYVNIFINPNSTLYHELNTPGGWLYLTAAQPSRGILVYRMNMDEFRAYERTCPYDFHDPGARISVEASGITAACPVCGSKFILLDGTPFEGPATRSLRQYRTSYDGNTLHIFN